ncbi:two-component system sensor histidine kinase NreB [Bacillus mesophilus]|uniref:histidine kinase n=1 Tax=Bacillus mesophilus TaxID=1808955 RepID=A0A6M0QBN7_9BACI|nr:histidine kinase [Bacillus mesophilus]MBM7660107.1 two-component system sensor histidine kinase NreB [Bacillus mesophilus]NEY73762.1 hypothetical protein [Bacillus mesophilus]
MPLSSKTLSEVIHSFERENKRISSELHEGIAQTLYSVYTGLQIIEMKNKDQEIGQQVNQLTHLVERSIADLRWLATDLHPPSMDDYGVFSALKAYVTIYIKTFGTEVLLHSIGTEVRFSGFSEKLLFRSCQETLKIIGKCSETEEITIIFDWDESSVRISFHIKGLKESSIDLDVEMKKVKAKTLLIHGDLEIRKVSEMETVLTIDVPYPVEVNELDQNSISG